MTWILIILSLSAAGEPDAVLDSKHASMFDCFKARALYIGSNPDAPKPGVICLEHNEAV